MWAAGSGESIAVSTDAGQHWQIKHQDPKGALLLVLNFVDDKFGYAAGTGGKVLFTQDGGESWTAQKLADETILQVAFGDAQHGVVRTLTALISTTDGGKTWQPVAPADNADWVRKLPYTMNMAALDRNHLAVLVSEDVVGGQYLSTADGGSTWSLSFIGGSEILGMFAAGGSYWSVGREVMPKGMPNAGNASPMAFHSKDGISWEHTPVNHEVCGWHDCAGCTPQGCFAGKSSFLQFLDGQDWLAKFPPHEELSTQWAKSGNTLCLLSKTSVECTTLQPVETIDTKEDTPSWDRKTIPAIGKIHISNPQCIICELNQVYFSDFGNSGPADVKVDFVLDASGHVSDVSILSKLPDDVHERILKEVQNWFFEPFIKDGQAAATKMSLRGHVVLLNPAKPPAGPIPRPQPNSLKPVR
jgi:hypothetical protein